MLRRDWLRWAGLAAANAGAAPAGVLTGPLLRNEAWPRATSLREWVGDVMRIAGVEKASETAQGKAFFEWLRLFNRMAVGGMIQAYEGEYGKESYVLDAHKQLFVYGWGYCDTTSRIAEAAWQEWKGDARAAERVITQHEDGGYHTMYRLRIDGRFGAFDPRYGYYIVERDAADARILDWGELHGRIVGNKAFRERSRPFFEIGGLEWERALLLQPGYFASEKAWRAAGAPKENVFGDGAYRMGTRFHAMNFELRKGMAVERFWSNAERKFYVPAGTHTKREWPFLADGRFYRVTDASHGGNWVKTDPNYGRARAHLAAVPKGAGYPADLEGGRTIGQAYGVLEYAPRMEDGVADGAGGIVFDVTCPYVLVDGTVTATLAGDGAELAVRTLGAKTRHAGEADVWSAWQTVAAGAGGQVVELGRPRFNGRDVSIHGRYRFQVRAKGAAGVRMKLFFENGVMAIPPLFAGRNRLQFELADAGLMTGPVTVSYRYETAAGVKEVRRVLGREKFQGNVAAFEVDAPGLVRCQSVRIAY